LRRRRRRRNQVVVVVMVVVVVVVVVVMVVKEEEEEQQHFCGHYYHDDEYHHDPHRTISAHRGIQPAYYCSPSFPPLPLKLSNLGNVLSAALSSKSVNFLSSDNGDEDLFKGKEIWRRRMRRRENWSRFSAYCLEEIIANPPCY